MTDPTLWKKTLEEPNALGWITLFVLVIAIGAGVLYFGAENDRTAASTRPVAADHASRR